MNILIEVNKVIPKRFVYEAPNTTSALEYNKKISIDLVLYNILSALKVDTDNPDRAESSLKLDYKRFSSLLPALNGHLKELKIAITTSSVVSDDAMAYEDAMIPFVLVKL